MTPTHYSHEIFPLPTIAFATPSILYRSLLSEAWLDESFCAGAAMTPVIAAAEWLSGHEMFVHIEMTAAMDRVMDGPALGMSPGEVLDDLAASPRLLRGCPHIRSDVSAISPIWRGNTGQIDGTLLSVPLDVLLLTLPDGSDVALLSSSESDRIHAFARTSDEPTTLQVFTESHRTACLAPETPDDGSFRPMWTWSGGEWKPSAGTVGRPLLTDEGLRCPMTGLPLHLTP